MKVNCEICGKIFDSNTQYIRKTCSSECNAKLKSQIQKQLYKQINRNPRDGIEREKISKLVFKYLKDNQFPTRISRNDIDSFIEPHFDCYKKFRRKCITLAVPLYGYSISDQSTKNDTIFIKTLV